MDIMEILIFLFSGYFSLVFLIKWYQLLLTTWPPKRTLLAQYIFACLPIVSLIIILYTLIALASFDVVGDSVYVVFYVAVGLAWIYFGLMLMSCLFDLSWIDDVINLDNKAALAAISGGFLGLTIIYAGANIGDGPGWWCVIFAGGLGLISWFILGLIIHKFTKIYERITIERDIDSGIRLGFYLFASGIILARASAGDWTSFYMTLVEFMDGWPVLFMTTLAIIVERNYIRNSNLNNNISDNYRFASILWGIVYVVISIASVMLLPPLRENPFYAVSAALIG